MSLQKDARFWKGSAGVSPVSRPHSAASRRSASYASRAHELLFSLGPHPNHRREYRPGQWARSVGHVAAQWAKVTIAAASEIWIVGYQIAGMDRAMLVSLLESAVDCRRIVIQNPDAGGLCARLGAKHPKIKTKLEQLDCKF